MEEAITLLETLYNKVRAERWRDNKGKLGVMTGIKMCIIHLKFKAGLKWRYHGLVVPP